MVRSQFCLGKNKTRFSPCFLLSSFTLLDHLSLTLLHHLSLTLLDHLSFTLLDHLSLTLLDHLSLTLLNNFSLTLLDHLSLTLLCRSSFSHPTKSSFPNPFRSLLPLPYHTLPNYFPILSSYILHHIQKLFPDRPTNINNPPSPLSKPSLTTLYLNKSLFFRFHSWRKFVSDK